jgi:hypothetical protein
VKVSTITLVSREVATCSPSRMRAVEPSICSGVAAGKRRESSSVLRARSTTGRLRRKLALVLLDQ